jgi:plasmid maintenance system killer protein
VKFRLLISISLFLFINFKNLEAGSNCNAYEQLSNPALQSNSKFWSEYAELNSEGTLTEGELQKLVDKHINGQESHQHKPDTVVTQLRNLKLEISNKAKKEIAKLDTKILKESYEEFMTIMSDYTGIKKLRENPGRWNLERIKAFKDEPVYTIRLNGSYRVLFKLEKDELTIMRVNVDDIHNL